MLEPAKGNVVYNAGEPLCIPKCCTQPELAWGFLKFCISRLDGPQKFSPVDGSGADVADGKLPVNRGCLDAYAMLYGAFSEEGTATEEKLVKLLEDVNRSNTGTGNAYRGKTL